MTGRHSAAAWLARAALPLLSHLPPELAHTLALRGLSMLRPAWGPRPAVPGLASTLLGLTFAHPVGLAAGFDKNGDYLDALGALGFSHIEVGTVTPRAQPGNSRPRLIRVRSRQALVNRMGFNNRGADYVAAQLRRSRFAGVRGVSIGKNADTPIERAADDYLECLRKLYSVADYFAINVSSPNTQRLRELQAADALAGIIVPLQQERARLTAEHGKSVPLLVKISPDLDSGQLSQLCTELKRLGVDGVIATNTSADLTSIEAAANSRGGGGLSGAPLNGRSLAVLRELRQMLGADFPIISVGGIMSAEVANERLAAGANLIQLYTGFVYRGASLLHDIIDSLPCRHAP